MEVIRVNNIFKWHKIYEIQLKQIKYEEIMLYLISNKKI